MATSPAKEVPAERTTLPLTTSFFAFLSEGTFTRRVKLVRRDGRDVSTLYGREGGGGGGERGHLAGREHLVEPGNLRSAVGAQAATYAFLMGAGVRLWNQTLLPALP